MLEYLQNLLVEAQRKFADTIQKNSGTGLEISDDGGAVYHR